MALSLKHQIKVLGGFNNATWTAVISPISECRSVAVFNVDGVLALSVCTDTTDASSVLSIAAGVNYSFDLSSAHKPGFSVKDTILYVKGAGAAPVIAYAA